MSTSNVEYEKFEYDIKISINAYKYQKLWVWLESLIVLNNHCWFLIWTKALSLISQHIGYKTTDF